MAGWQSWPQACMTAVSSPAHVMRARDLKDEPFCLTTGNASISARAATTGPSPVSPRNVPTTPVTATASRTSRRRRLGCAATRRQAVMRVAIALAEASSRPGSARLGSALTSAPALLESDTPWAQAPGDQSAAPRPPRLASGGRDAFQVQTAAPPEAGKLTGVSSPGHSGVTTQNGPGWHGSWHGPGARSSVPFWV